MKHCTILLPILAGMTLLGCSSDTADGLAKADAAPATVEHIEGSEISRVTLSAKAAERLGIQTALVREAAAGAIRPVGTTPGSPRMVVPYAAVLYDAHGDTWVYTSPQPLVFIRHHIKVLHIEGDLAVLSEGPPAGTEVVTVGAAELFGTEFEVGH